MSRPAIPAGMAEVSKEEFFAAIGPQNVHPSVRHRDYTTWETPRREVVGWSLPGWANPGEPSVWAIRRKTEGGDS